MSKLGTNAGKDVLYVDVDDEITAIIDKVRDSKQKIVALVLPKRASVLQSVVNMRLLKRSSDGANKKLVLITSELNLMPLAGAVGIHVAKTLQSKPEIPAAPPHLRHASEDIEEVSDDTGEAAERSVDATRTVGELAGAAAVDSELDDTIELDNEPADSAAPAGTAAGIIKGNGSGKEKKKFKIPNFNKFRLWLVLGVAVLIILIGGSVMAFKVMPRANVHVKTDSTAISSVVPIAFKTAADTELDEKEGVIAATIQQTQKTQQQQVPATGQQNNGQKAVGSVVMTAKDCASPFAAPDDVPAGAGVSAAGNTYVTQSKASFALDGASGGCVNFKTASIVITAQTGGAKYNVESATMTVVGRSEISATGSASGGTDDIIKVVTQTDIEAAKQKIGGQDTEQLHNELKNGLITKGLYAVDQTFKSSEADTKLSANPGDKADVVTVTQTITYTMMGVKRDDLEKIIKAAASEKIDTKKQSILDYGIDDAQIEVQSQDANGAVVTITTTVVAGPELDVAVIKKQVAGKKAGDASKILKATPGVTDVQVEYSPFWVSSIPGNTSKITVSIEKPTVKTDDDKQP